MNTATLLLFYWIIKAESGKPGNIKLKWIDLKVFDGHIFLHRQISFGKIFFNTICFKFLFALFKGVPKRGRCESHNIQALVFSEIWHQRQWFCTSFEFSSVWKMILRMIFKIIYWKVNVQNQKPSHWHLCDTIHLKEVRYNCNAHHSAHLFITPINSHSYIKRKQPQRIFQFL